LRLSSCFQSFDACLDIMECVVILLRIRFCSNGDTTFFFLDG